MKTFYKVTITKQSVGSAVRYKEPPLQGKIIAKVTDMESMGDYRIVIMECDEVQHKTILTMGGVVELSEKESVKLAAQFQPKRTVTKFNPRTRKAEKIRIPACNLNKLYENQAQD